MKTIKILMLLLTLLGTAMAKRDITLIQKDLEKAHAQVTIGGQYYHYKKPDVIYVVHSLSVDIDNEERILVNYQVAHDVDNVVWSRSFDDFISKVQITDAVVQKFTKIHHP